MPFINHGIVCNIIQKAREINIAGDLELPENQEDMSEAEWSELLAEYQNDLGYIELKSLIDELEPDQQLDIIALMYVGRGDFSAKEWGESRHEAHAIKPGNRANYLISKPMLADYLTEGLAVFGYSCDE